MEERNVQMNVVEDLILPVEGEDAVATAVPGS